MLQRKEKAKNYVVKGVNKGRFLLLLLNALVGVYLRCIAPCSLGMQTDSSCMDLSVFFLSSYTVCSFDTSV